MRSPVPLILALLVATGCRPSAETGDANVENAVVTLPAVAGRPGAAYFTLRAGADAVRLTGIDSDSVERIELHETVESGGVSRMVALTEIPLTPAEPLVFAPGGRHAMLFGVDPDLRPGSRIRLTFRFDAAPPIVAEAEVRGPGDAGHAEH
jgi:copper(I)-binding protein